MTQRTYTPNAGSLPSMVVGFFTNNPDEELTLEDIADKFQCSRNNIHTNLALATQHGLLLRDRNDDGDYVYRPGNALRGEPTGIDIDAVNFKPRKDAPAKVALPNVLDVQIDSDVPLPSAKLKFDWLPLLQRLQPSQSALLPLAAKYTLSNTITEAHKAGLGKYTMRTFPDDQTLRVWRTA